MNDGENKQPQSGLAPANAIALPGDLDRQLAVRSYNALSHVPEQRADTDIRFYVEAVEALHKKLCELAKTPEQQALIPAQLERYKANYREHQHAIWAAQTRAASAFIVGPANFPTAHKNKRLNTVDRRRAELLAWKRRAEQAAARVILDARSGEQLMADEWRKLARHLAHDVGIIKGHRHWQPAVYPRGLRHQHCRMHRATGK
jgi:hypothetical protein